jgi:hypothetical protein
VESLTREISQPRSRVCDVTRASGTEKAADVVLSGVGSRVRFFSWNGS